jgi:TM2 domain-containing membrane protein YozV
MSEEPTPTASEIQLKIRELLGRATLLRTKGQRQQALQLAQQAVGMDDESWEAHELAGDLLLELGRGDYALDSYRRARELNPSRTSLEDKIARAALARAARLQTTTMSEALLSGRIRPAPARKPGFAALMSMIAPGLGQLYNGEVIKGFVLLALSIVCFGLTGTSLRGQIVVGPASPQGSLYGSRIDLGAIGSALFSGITALWVILLFIVWVYSIADAAIVASRMNTSDGSGLV